MCLRGVMVNIKMEEHRRNRKGKYVLVKKWRVVEVKKDKLKASQCPDCGTFMDKAVGWVCSKCGKKTK